MGEFALRSKFSGVHVAMNSCYDEFGEIDEAAVKRLTRFLIDKGVQGVYVGGGTGEGLLQTVEERKRVLEAVAGENGGRMTVTAHTGAMTTKDSAELARHAERAGADAISSVPPFYYAYTEQAVKDYWLEAMNGADLPFLIYHIPGATGFQVTPRLVRDLREAAPDRLVGMKVTVFSTYELQQFKASGGDEFIVMNGPDQQYLAGRVMGADGGIGGTYGVMPELFLRIESHIRQGRLLDAQRWQFRVNGIITDMRELGLFGAIKQLIRLRGIECGEPRRPLPSLPASKSGEAARMYETIMRYVAEAEVEAAAEAEAAVGRSNTIAAGGAQS